MSKILIYVSILALIIYLKKWRGNDKNFISQCDDHIKDHWSFNNSFTGKGFFNKRVSSADERIGGCLSCPKFGLESQNQHWFKFRTDDKSWQNLAGSEGFYSRCPECEIIVNDSIATIS